jgi:tetratricopeptide (TPR) repeat protein
MTSASDSRAAGLWVTPENDVNIERQRGVARQRRGDLARAVSDYNWAIELNPRLTDAYLNRGAVRYEQGQYDGAIADCAQAIKLNESANCLSRALFACKIRAA